MSDYRHIYRGNVDSWECDTMGHLNIQFYTAKLTSGMAQLRAMLGMTPDHMRRNGHAMVATRCFSRYLRELHAGDIVNIDVGLLRVDDRRVDFVAELCDAHSGGVSASFEITCVSFDLEARRAVPWPDQVRGRIEGLLTERRDRPRPPTAGGPVPAVKGDPATPFITARGAVAAWECDQLGHMSAHLYYSRASDGIGHIRHRMGITQEITRRHHWGGAALEYDVRFLAEMAAGDIYSLRSGLLDLADKTFRFGHCLHNDSTGEISATFDVVACMFDLQARRAMPIPDEVRARAEGLMIPWPPSEWTEARAAE